MTKPRFNLALMPRDEDITEALYSHAHILRKAAAGYCIAPNKALAHVTLCQFCADDDIHAKRITDQFIGTACRIKITGLYQRPYPADPALLWFGYSVQHDEDLMALQHSAHQSLTKTADSVLTGTAHDYDPHFTLAVFVVVSSALARRFARYSAASAFSALKALSRASLSSAKMSPRCDEISSKLSCAVSTA